MHILYSTNPLDAKIEGEMRQWFRDNFGDDDAKTLIEWLWDNHRDGVRFVEALSAIAVETEKNGLQFVHNLLDMARKPKLVRDAEMELIAWAKPRIEKATATIRGHRGSPESKKSEMDNFVFALEEKLYTMWPGKHRATMKGAILAAFRDVEGRLELNVATLVKTLNIEDPMSATAATAGRHR